MVPRFAYLLVHLVAFRWENDVRFYLRAPAVCWWVPVFPMSPPPLCLRVLRLHFPLPSACAPVTDTRQLSPHSPFPMSPPSPAWLLALWIPLYHLLLSCPPSAPLSPHLDYFNNLLMGFPFLSFPCDTLFLKNKQKPVILYLFLLYK